MQRPQYEHTTYLSHISCHWHHCSLNDRHFKVKTMRNFTPDNFNSTKSFVKLLSEEFELMSVTQLQHTQSVLTSDLQQYELWPPPQSHGPPEALRDFKHWRDLRAARTVDQILPERTGIPPFMETYSTHTLLVFQKERKLSDSKIFYRRPRMCQNTRNPCFPGAFALSS